MVRLYFYYLHCPLFCSGCTVVVTDVLKMSVERSGIWERRMLRCGAPVLGNESGAASCFSMGERPDWASTLFEPLLRPTVTGHGLPADSRRCNTLLPQDTVEAMGSQSWRTHYKAGFEAYSAELLRQGWEPSTGSWWGDKRAGPFARGWNQDDFNAVLLRRGCVRPPGASGACLLGKLLAHRMRDARRKMQKECGLGRDSELEIT